MGGRNFKVSRFQGFKVSRFQGFKVSRFQGFKVSGMRDRVGRESRSRDVEFEMEMPL
jgi:hypothetical protein